MRACATRPRGISNGRSITTRRSAFTPTRRRRPIPSLASHAWLALGNAFFEQGIKATRQPESEDAAAENAEFDLARDAYRSALRIDPWLHDARYNLELLERLAPTHAREGWRRNTDPVAIQPTRHNGWTTIQESPKRGLP